MPFERQVNRVPTSIGEVRVELFDPDGQTAHMRAEYTLIVYDQFGRELKVLSGDLVPFITTAQRNVLIQFLTDMRAQAVSQVL